MNMGPMLGSPVITTVFKKDGSCTRRIFVNKTTSDLYLAGVRDGGCTHYSVEAAIGDGWEIPS